MDNSFYLIQQESFNINRKQVQSQFSFGILPL